ncbi:MAG: AAC(3) family N-acetyltransferase [Armatimonadota bacterium]
MPATELTGEQISEGLRRLGLRAGDIVMVHSSLSSLGEVDGGAATVVKALLDVLGPSGTLVAPTFGAPAPFDVKESPSGLGAITEAVRRWPGAVRSLHPTHAVSAIGPHAEQLTEGHLASPTAAGRDTPYGRLIEMGGKILLIGVDNDRNTTMHTLEEYVEAPYLSDRSVTYLDDQGRVQTKRLRLFPGPHRDFIGLGALFRREGVEVVARIGDAICRLIDAKRMHDVVLAAFRDDPALVLCTNPECDDCVTQRRKIRLSRLAGETFTLSALASSVSPFPDEIASELRRAGVGEVLLDRLYHRPVWEVNDVRLRRAAALFAEEGIAVTAVSWPADPSRLDRWSAVAEAAGATRAVTALTADAKAMADGAASSGKTLWFENIALPTDVCLRLVESVGPEPVFAFNPASFALLGERPFLKVFQTRLKRRIGLFYLSDATFGGRYTLPGRGNAEVKELLSILRCRCFAGPVVIGTGPGGPPFRELVEAFWSLLESL